MPRWSTAEGRAYDKARHENELLQIESLHKPMTQQVKGRAEKVYQDALSAWLVNMAFYLDCRQDA